LETISHSYVFVKEGIYYLPPYAGGPPTALLFGKNLLVPADQVPRHRSLAGKQGCLQTPRILVSPPHSGCGTPKQPLSSA